MKDWMGHLGLLGWTALALTGVLMMSTTAGAGDLPEGAQARFGGEVKDGWDAIDALAATADGTLIAVNTRDHGILVWDVVGQKLRHTLKGHKGRVSGLVFSADGHHLISGGMDKLIQVWDVRTGKALRTLKGHTDGIGELALSHDDTVLVSAGFDRKLGLWDWRTGRLLRFVEATSDSVFAVATSPRDKKIAAAEYGDILIRDLTSGAPLRALEARSCEDKATDRVLCLEPYEAIIEEFPEGPDDTFATYKTMSLHLIVFGLAFSPDGRILAAAREGGEVVLIDVGTGKGLRRLSGHEGKARAVAFSADGRLLATGGEDGIVKLWDPRTGALVKAFKGHRGSVDAVAFMPGGRLASGGDGGAVIVWKHPATKD